MAKTTFVDGTSTIWASFMNSIFNTDGGHKHDGGTDDGSAGKIDPATEVDWGTNAAVSLIADNAAKVHWWLNHAAAGTFGLTLDFLFGVDHISTSTGVLNIGSAPGTPNQDLACTDISATGLVTTTGQVNGDIKVTGPGTFYSIVTFHWNGSAVVIDEEYGGRVASIARGVAGYYTVTFTDAIPLGTTHPMWAASSDSAKDGEMVTTARVTAPTTVRVRAKNSAAGSLDPELVHLFIPQMS